MPLNPHALIAAIILPIPIIHLWLHALLPWWRRHVALFYTKAVALWIVALLVLPLVHAWSPTLFLPTPLVRWIGFALISIGIVCMLISFFTLGPRRFFVLAVLRPGNSHLARIGGIFNIIPHPAYQGYVAVALGNFLTSGKLYLGGVFMLLLVTTPIVIWFEEHEMRERFGRGSSS